LKEKCLSLSIGKGNNNNLKKRDMLEIGKDYKVTTPYCVYAALVLLEIRGGDYIFGDLNGDDFILLEPRAIVNAKLI
jgi:hypothetical protein